MTALCQEAAILTMQRDMNAPFVRSMYKVRKETLFNVALGPPGNIYCCSSYNETTDNIYCHAKV